MKKKVLASLLVAAMAASMVAGCGDNTADTTKNDTTAKDTTAKDTTAADTTVEEEEITCTLQVMGPSEDLDDAQGAWLKARCEAFAAAHPNWHINFEYLTCSESDAKDTVLQDVANAADVYMFANDQLKALVDGGAIAKLGGDAAEYVKSSNSEAMAATVMLNGDVYGVPYTSNTWFMYYDKRVFSEEDVKSMETMLEKGKVSFPLDNGWYLCAFFTANGCTFYGDGSQESAGIDFSGDKATAVSNYIVNLVQNPNFVVDSNDGSLGLAGLGDGSVNVYFNGNWNYNNVVEKLGAENVGVAQLPTITIDGEAKQMKAFLGSKAIGVNPNADNMQVAVALAAFLGSEESQLAHFELRGQAPVATSLATNETIAADPVATALANVAANTSVCQPVFGMDGYWTAATPFGAAFVPGAEDQITADNAAEKTQAFNDQCNGSVVE